MAVNDVPRSAVASRLTFRPLARADFAMVSRWLTNPHVFRWWQEDCPTVAAVEEKYGETVDGGGGALLFVIESAGQPVGLIQCYRHVDHPEWDRLIRVPESAGIDYLIGEPELCGRGLGSAAIAAFCVEVFGFYPDITSVVAVPQRDNIASCRALAKAGFDLIDERFLGSDDPADAGISAVYHLPRPAA